MNPVIDHTQLHRTAKYFMDSGRATTHDHAMDILRGYGLSISIGPEVAVSAPHQIALLTLVNMARRTFLAGIEVSGMTDARLLVPLAPGVNLAEAVRFLGGVVTNSPNGLWPSACIGSCERHIGAIAAWQLTWQGWRGGVVPAHSLERLGEDNVNTLAPAVAAAVCAAELFAWHAKDHLMAGKRTAGLSLWTPGSNWLFENTAEPQVSYLPSRLWLIGLGNLGQAFAWLLTCLPYGDRNKVELLLQDYDKIAPSNNSTSLLSSMNLVGRKKIRVIADWLEAAGFSTTLDERRFGPWTTRGPYDPGVALCGVDNAQTRAELEKPGFDLVVEAGLGAGPNGFRNFSMHSFPSSRRPDEIWSRKSNEAAPNLSAMPAYKALQESGINNCGLAQLASRTVGVPFVGLIAAAMAVAEPIRRLHGAEGYEFVSGSVSSLNDIEGLRMPCSLYSYGHLPVLT